MKSILICEGKTDADFLQYYMRKVNLWEDGRATTFTPKGFTFGRVLVKNNDELSLIALNGSGDIINGVKETLEYNINNRPNKIYNKIVFVTDNDEENTIADKLSAIDQILNAMGIVADNELENSKWTGLQYQNSMGEKLYTYFLPMIIPFANKGAIETFLLEAISQKDPYDKSIIEKGKEYVKEADPEKRYLKKRRHITKAEYEVFFAIRTTEGQFNDRRDILKGIPWEDYTNIQESFKEFAKI